MGIGIGMPPHQSPPVTITPYPDGPYLVRGEFVVRDRDGRELPLQRRTIALCRCGKSRLRPLCDGTHKLIGFKAPSAPEPWPDA
jgi:CDGSH-type Zn-finger protein